MSRSLFARLFGITRENSSSSAARRHPAGQRSANTRRSLFRRRMLEQLEDRSLMAVDSLISIGVPQTENFDGMGATLNLPTGWRMADRTASPVYSSAATTVTQQSSGVTNPTAGGTYNFGQTATERAVGAMTSGSFASPNNLLVQMTNNTGTTIDKLTIDFAAERYRINTAAASVQFFFSTNGSTWTAIAGGNIATSDFPTGASSYTFASGTRVTRTGIETPAGLNIAPSENIFLRWNINTTGSNSQGIAIDDVVVTASSAAADTTPPTVTSITHNEDNLDNTVVAGEMVTYTVAFSEDINAATVTETDFLNAGSSAVTFGTITETSPGVFTIEVTPTTAGTLRLGIDDQAVIQDLAGNALLFPSGDILDEAEDVITVTAGDITPPTVVSINDNDADDIIGVGATVIYTVTFSEDINEATVSASDFDNAGTSSVTFGTITETSPGVFTVPVTATTAGTLQLRISGSILDLAGNALVVAPPILDAETINVDGTAPTLTSITDNVSGGPGSVNQPITYTITFSEDIDAATVTAADFDNAGTATTSVGAITETLPGVFSVVVTPTTTGTVQLRIPTTAEIADVAGNNLDVTTALLDDTVITVNAVTTLTVGDIAFTGIQTDAPDQFSFVLLKDVVAGTQISFTDNGWGDGSFAITSENTATVTFGSAVTAGTHLYVIDQSGGAFRFKSDDSSAGTIVGNLSGLSASGDSILAYQGDVPTSNDATNWIAGINTRSFAANPGNTNQSNLPSALQIGVTAIQLSNTTTDVDNGAYNLAAFEGTVDQIRASVKNIANWTTNNNIGPNSTTVFTVSADTTPPTVTSIDDGDADDAVLVNEALTYTITFSEDINASTVNAADFDNAGSSAITIGAITETSPGVFTVVVTPTSVGTLQLRIKSDANIQDVAGNALVGAVTDDTTVTVSSSDTTPPTVVSIDDGDADNLVPGGAVLTYVVTFSEDIDESTVSAADFDNAGTASITLGTITETSPGVFSVVVTATSGGTLQLRIPSSADIRDLANNALAVPVLDDDTLTVDATAPTLVSITDNASGGPVLTGTTIVYTVTFSEDIDGASVTAADFSNAGTAAITVGAISETSPGVFSVAVLTTSSGTVILQIPTGSVISDIVGNQLSVPQQDDTTIQVNNSALVTGDIAFVGYNADGTDDFAFVALVNISGGERIVFTDNEWNGSAFNTGEGEIIWTAPASGVAAGTVIQINSVSQVSTISATVGTVTGTFNIGASDEAIFAITGSQAAPSAFLTAISNDGAAGFTSLVNTGLILGVNAIDFTIVDIDADVMAYTGTRSTRGTFAAYRRLINDPTNWVTQDGGGDQHNDGTAPDVPFDNTAFTLATQSSILLINEVVFDPEGAVDTGEEYIELRGTPNTIVPEDAFLVLIDGDSEDGAGNVDHIFDIRGMAFGSNGYLVLRQFGSTYVIDPAASVFTATSEGWGANWSSRATDIENGSVSVLLIQTSTSPVADTDVDANNDGTLDGVATSWTIRDAIGNIDGGVSDTAYGFLNTSGNGSGLVPAGSTLVNLSGYHPDYMARNGNSTGHTLVNSTASDWVVGELAGAMPTITLATGGFTFPAAFAGAAIDDLGAENNFSVALATPTITITSGNVVYSNSVYVATASVSGFNAPDPTGTLTFTYFADAAGTTVISAPEDVGTYWVRASTSANAGNNAAQSAITPFQITPFGLTALATASDKVYDGNALATVSIELPGVFPGDSVTASASGTFASKNAGLQTVTVGTVTLSGASASNYTVTAPANPTATITPKALTATATAQNKIYDGGQIASVTINPVGVVSGDVVNITAIGTFDNKNVGTGKVVTISGISASGADAGNYTLDSVPNTMANITALVISVNATAQDKVYDGTTTASVSLTLDGVLSGDTVTIAGSGNFENPNVGSNKPVILSGLTLGGPDGGNYQLGTSTNPTASITAKALTVSANPANKVYGAADPALTFSADGLVSGDSVTGLLTRAAGENVGNYAIQQGSITAGSNYTLSFVGAFLQITPAPLTVTANALSKTVGQVDPPLTFTTSTLVNGDTVATALTGSLIREPGETVGIYAINQGTLDAVNGNYNITFVGANFTINAAVAAPTLTSVVVNGTDFTNAAQRSMVTSLQVTFSTPVVLSPGAFSITNIGLFTASNISLDQSQIIVTPNATSDVFTIRFGAGPSVNSRLGSGALGNSLADGNYRLTIDPTKVSNAGGNLTGNNLFGAAAADNFFRMYGDANGDGAVNALDRSAFMAALAGAANAALDFDGNGSTSAGADTTNYFANNGRRRRLF